ncbi:helix-turn-helix domain-containing protein, partial [Escherichia coli]|uniref:plasmid replication DNA-binding protein n=2 Tax=Gammaproteobacteria TaxID=1236 RepID=UPI0011F13CE0
MSLLTIVEASRKFNIGRTTIYKAIKKGEITPQLSELGVQQIDPQDMIRVFGHPGKKAVSGDTKSNVSVNNDDLVRELRLQIEELKQDKSFLKQEIASVRRDFDDFK